MSVHNVLTEIDKAAARLFGTPSSSANVLSGRIWQDCPWSLLRDNPGAGIAYFNDFNTEIDVTSADGYVITQTTTGAIKPSTTIEGGALWLDTAGHTTANDGLDVQLTNCLFKAAAGRTLWYEARMKVTDVSDNMFIGLAGIDTSLFSAASTLDDVVDKAGFYHLGSGTDLKICTVTSRLTADDATSDVAAIADDTWVNVGFVIRGLTCIEFYVNNVLVEVGSTVANLPNAIMCPSYSAKCAGTSADADLFVDWVRIAQYGRT